MTTFLSDSYDYLKDTVTHIKSLKTKKIQGRTLRVAVQKYL